MFELEILCRLKNNILYNLNIETNWKYDDQENVSYVNDSDDINIDSLNNNTWLIPLKYNYGCMDMMYYHHKGKVDLVQVTIANKHEYKLSNIIPIIKQLSINNNNNNDIDNDDINGDNNTFQCKVNFYIFIPSTNANDFNIIDAEFKSKDLIANLDKH